MKKLTARALVSVFTAAGFLIALPVQAYPAVGTPPACGGNKDSKKKQKKQQNPSVTARADSQCSGGDKGEKKKKEKKHDPSFSDAA